MIKINWLWESISNNSKNVQHCVRSNVPYRNVVHVRFFENVNPFHSHV